MQGAYQYAPNSRAGQGQRMALGQGAQMQPALEPPRRPSSFASMDELNQYLEDLQKYYALLGRPRFEQNKCFFPFYDRESWVASYERDTDQRRRVHDLATEKTVYETVLQNNVVEGCLSHKCFTFKNDEVFSWHCPDSFQAVVLPHILYEWKAASNEKRQKPSEAAEMKTGETMQMPLESTRTQGFQWDNFHGFIFNPSVS